MALAELLLLAGYAGSVKAKSNREKAAAEAAATAEKTATQQQQAFELQKQVQSKDLELRNSQILKSPSNIVQHADGSQQVVRIGSPYMLPEGSTIVERGSLEKGFTTVNKPPVNAYMIDGTPMSSIQVREKYGLKTEMLLGSSQAPFVGQFHGGEFKETTQPILDMNKKKEVAQGFKVGDQDFTNYGAAFRFAQETGQKLRTFETVTINGQQESQTVSDFDPNKDAGFPLHWGYITYPNGDKELTTHQSEKALRRNLKVAEGGGAKVEYGGIRNFVPGTNGKPRFVKQPTIDMTDKQDIEYVLDDGTKVLASDITADQLKNAVQQRPVTITPDGEVKRETAGSSINVGKTAEALEDANFRLMVKGVGSHRIGPRSDITSARDNIQQIAATTRRAIADGFLVGETATPESQQDYVGIVGPALLGFLNPVVSTEGQVLQNYLQTAEAAAVNQGLSAILAVPGIKEFLRAKDIQGADQKARGMQQKAQGIGGPTLLSVEPITNQIGEVTASIYAIKSLPPRLEPFANRLKQRFTRITGDEQLATNTMSRLIIDKRDPITMIPLQRPDGLGPVASEDQSPILALEAMSKSIVTPASDDYVPAGPDTPSTGTPALTQLDMLEGIVNGGDEGAYPIMAAVTEDDITSISIQLSTATGGKLEPLFYTVRSFVNARSPYHHRKLNTKYGLNMETAAGKRQKVAFKTQVTAAGRGIGVANAAIRTYFHPTTGARLDSSVVGNFELSLAGLSYLGTYASNRVLNLFKSGNYAEASRGLLGAFKLGSRNDELTIKGEDPFAENSTLGKELSANIAAINAAGKDAEKRAYAVRGFHITVLAYELAAAIQGGTGGRTISDQDVQLILTSLKQGKLDEPTSQLAALETARDMLMEIRFKAQMLSSEDPKDNAAIVIADEFMVRTDPLLTVEVVADRITNSIAGTTNEKRDIPEAAILRAYNRSLVSDGQTSVNEITDDMKETPLYKQVLKSFSGA